MADGDGVWTITRQQEDTRYYLGSYTDGVVVFFTTGGGNQGSVFVPNADYSPARVQAEVKRRAEAMDMVGELTGG